MWQQDAYCVIQRRTRGTGIKTRIGNHTFRATGITAYLKNTGDRMRFRSLRWSALRLERVA